MHVWFATPLRQRLNSVCRQRIGYYLNPVFESLQQEMGCGCSPAKEL